MDFIEGLLKAGLMVLFLLVVIGALAARLRRHPVPMQAWFDHSLVVTYAYPEAVLAPLLPPGLTIHGYAGLGFLAVAVVRARHLRPVGVPRWMGVDLVLTGYRIFARMRTADGRELRGLRILRSDASHRLMGLVGNRLTHYGFRPCRASVVERADEIAVAVSTSDGLADLQLVADLSSRPAPLPTGSPFPSLAIARRFAGPLPYTFDHDPRAQAMIVIEGRREQWDPQPIRVTVERCDFLDHPALAGHRPILANAFLVSGIPYSWRRGRLEALPP